MGKGRRLTTSRSERYLGSYGYGNNHSNTSANDAPELGEDDIWSMMENGSGIADGNINSQGACDERNGNVLFRMIPREERRHHVGGLSLAFEDSIPPSDNMTTTSTRIVHQHRGQHESVNPPSSYHMATSAPVHVPDWSKIYRVDSVESLHDSDDGLNDRDLDMVPPHEYLAREYARSEKMGGASVFEGLGRTLKGRDLRRVRDAVWSQTGFDG